jgi:hypothetical protein
LPTGLLGLWLVVIIHMTPKHMPYTTYKLVLTNRARDSRE